MPLGVGPAPNPAPPLIEGFPIINLRVGWDAGVRDATAVITWNDLTPYLRSGSLKFGRNRQLARLEPARADFVLNDHDNILDPANASGPYYSRIRALARVTFTASWSGVVYPLFSGYLRRITHSRQNLDDETVTLECVDMSTVLNQAPVPSSVWAIEIEKDLPVHWWRMGDDDTAAIGDSGSQPLTATSYYVTSGQDLAAGGQGNSGSFDGEFAYALAGTGQPAVTTTSWTIEVPFRLAPGDIQAGAHTLVAQAGYGLCLEVIGNDPGLIASKGTARVLVYSPGADTFTYFGAPTLNVANSKLHLFSVTYNGTTMVMYIDGVQVASQAISGYSKSGPFTIGARYPGAPPTAPWKGQLGDVVVYDKVLTPTRIAQHWSALKDAWRGDAPGVRINRLLDHVGIPADDRSIGTGVCRLGPANLGSSLLTHLADVADADGGAFFADGSGEYTFHGREYLVTGPRTTTSQVKFSDVSGTGGVAYDLPLEVPVDDVYLANRAVVSRAGGAEQVADDLVAQARDLIRPVSRTGLIFESDDEALSAAHRLLDFYGKQSGRIGSISVIPMRDPFTLYALVLGLRLLDRWTFEHKPGATAHLEEVLVQGFVHDFSTSEWKTSVSVSPAGATTGWFFLGTAALNSSALY